MSANENGFSAVGIVILVVDDDPFYLKLVKRILSDQSILVLEAGSLLEATRILDGNTALKIDLMLLDRMLPDGDGLQLLKTLRQKAALKDMPVIIQSSLISAQDMESGVRAGAFYYLAKPFRSSMLIGLVELAIRSSRERKQLLDRLEDIDHAASFLSNASFVVRTLDDAKSLAPYLGRFFPNAESAVFGIFELLKNAIEHGNLEIGFELKGRLMANHTLEREIERRLALPEYQERQVHVYLERGTECVELLICDDGKGFDHQAYGAVSEKMLGETHGRGIAMARNFCFDGVEYFLLGNQVRCWSLL